MGKSKFLRKPNYPHQKSSYKKQIREQKQRNNTLQPCIHHRPIRTRSDFEENPSTNTSQNT